MQSQKKVNVLLNNAGVNFKGIPITFQLAKKILDTNFFGTVEFTEKMIPSIKRHGKIIFMGSERAKYRNIANK